MPVAGTNAFLGIVNQSCEMNSFCPCSTVRSCSASLLLLISCMCSVSNSVLMSWSEIIHHLILVTLPHCWVKFDILFCDDHNASYVLQLLLCSELLLLGSQQLLNKPHLFPGQMFSFICFCLFSLPSMGSGAL